MGPGEWAIRTATEADLPGALALWSAAGPLPSATDDEGSLALLLGRDPGALLLAEAGEEAIGTLIAAWDGWRGSFYRLAVVPAWRRRGVAAGLVAAGECRLHELGAARLTAIVAADEEAAMGLWESLGYRRQPDRSRFVRTLDR